MWCITNIYWRLWLMAAKPVWPIQPSLSLCVVRGKNRNRFYYAALAVMLSCCFVKVAAMAPETVPVLKIFSWN